jgi:hypothetical protein
VVIPLQRKAMALTFILMVTLASITAFAYYVSVCPLNEKENSLPPLSTVFALSLSPEPKLTPPPDPEVSFTYWDGAPSWIPQPPIVRIVSPQNNKTYRTNNFSLIVNVASQFWVIDSVYYEADWIEGHHRIFTVQPTSEMSLKVTITANFTEIPDGNHNITVYANTHNDAHAFSSLFFITDFSPPKISALSIENKTYNTADLPLNFTVDESTSWLGYSLDGQENVTIAENVTLQKLSYGSHSLIVYANDTVGNAGSSEKLYFFLSRETAPFPTALVATASLVAVAIAGTALLIYFKKRRHYK